MSPYWYAQIRLPDGTLTSNKSTRKESRAEAERVVIEWIVKGNLPTSYGKKGRAKGTTSLEFISVLNALKTIDFTEDEITSIISALKERRIITSAIRPEHKSNRDLIEYLEEFWDMEKSPYLKELEITSRSVRGIVNAIVQPMKYAYNHGLTDINCYDGLIKPAVQYAKREILTMEETRALFNAEWENQTAKLACLIACYTEMRAGEIQALRMQDIGDDRIYIRHSWN